MTEKPRQLWVRLRPDSAVGLVRGAQGGPGDQGPICPGTVPRQHRESCTAGSRSALGQLGQSPPQGRLSTCVRSLGLLKQTPAPWMVLSNRTLSLCTVLEASLRPRCRQGRSSWEPWGRRWSGPSPSCLRPPAIPGALGLWPPASELCAISVAPSSMSVHLSCHLIRGHLSLKLGPVRPKSGALPC